MSSDTVVVNLLLIFFSFFVLVLLPSSTSVLIRDVTRGCVSGDDSLSNGDLCWGRIGKGEGTSHVAEINADKSGDVFVAGTFEGKAGFDKKFIESLGTNDIFLAKYSTDGEIQWLKKGGSAVGEDKLNAVVVDSSGNILITGSFSGIAVFDQKLLKSKGSDDIFLVKYDKAGRILWATQTGGKGNEHSESMITDKQGNIFLTGNFNLSFSFGRSRINHIGDWDIFLAEYSPEGKMKGGTQVGGTGYDKGTGIAVDDSDHLYLTGYFIDKVSFGDIQVDSPGKEGCAFIAKWKGILGTK